MEKTEKNYYQIRLSTVDDFRLKMEKIVHFLSDYDDESTDLCHTVISDLMVFEEDIKAELEENEQLTIPQVDSMRVLWQQTVALRRFVDCIAFCSEVPTIGNKELEIASQLLDYQYKTIYSTQCSDAVEVSKEKYLFYFLVNKTPISRNIRYSYFSFSGDGKTGLKQVPANEAAPFYGVFNEYYNQWITVKSISCN